MAASLNWREPADYTRTQARRDGGVFARLISATVAIALNQEGVQCKRGLRVSVRKWHEILFCQFFEDVQNGVAYTVLALYNDLGREVVCYALGEEASQAQITAFLRRIGKEVREASVAEAEESEEVEQEPQPLPVAPLAPVSPPSDNATLTSSEFSALAQRELGAWAESRGFEKKAAGVLAWIRRSEKGDEQFSVRISPLGTNRYAGSAFQILALTSVASEVRNNREEGARRRLTELLSATELEQVRALQNAVISRLPPHPSDFGQSDIHESLLEHLNRQFQLIETEYATDSDVWFRYRTQEDVRLWLEAARGWLSDAFK